MREFRKVTNSQLLSIAKEGPLYLLENSNTGVLCEVYPERQSEILYCVQDDSDVGQCRKAQRRAQPRANPSA